MARPISEESLLELKAIIERDKGHPVDMEFTKKTANNIMSLYRAVYFQAPSFELSKYY